MKMISVYFARKKRYDKFLKVFTNSAKKVMPKIKVEIIKPKMQKVADHKRDTAFAFLAAAEYALKSKEDLIVADIDLMFEKSIIDAWDYDFDIAVTTRKKIKYNTGLWFYRPSPISINFVKNWIENTKKIMNNFSDNEAFCWEHGGIDQASLFQTIQENKKIKIKELPCQEWNATQSEWADIDDKTKVIHVKSKLRLAAFGKIDIPAGMEYLKPLVKKWKSYL